LPCEAALPSRPRWAGLRMNRAATRFKDGRGLGFTLASQKLRFAGSGSVYDKGVYQEFGTASADSVNLDCSSEKIVRVTWIRGAIRVRRPFWVIQQNDTGWDLGWAQTRSLQTRCPPESPIEPEHGQSLETVSRSYFAEESSCWPKLSSVDLFWP
jgi:hypothetical protein